jgi:hypothetical protein
MGERTHEFAVMRERIAHMKGRFAECHDGVRGAYAEMRTALCR